VCVVVSVLLLCWCCRIFVFAFFVKKKTSRSQPNQTKLNQTPPQEKESREIEQRQASTFSYFLFWFLFFWCPFFFFFFFFLKKINFPKYRPTTPQRSAVQGWRIGQRQRSSKTIVAFKHPNYFPSSAKMIAS